MPLTLTAARETARLKKPFRISGHVFEAFEVVVVTLDDGEHRGRGEGGEIYYLGNDVPHMLAEIEDHRTAIEAGLSREGLRQIMPAGGARNAVDAALWELEAKRSGQPVWQLAELSIAPKAVVTTFTVGADEPQVMAADARAYDHAKAIKIKLTGDLPLDVARVGAIRAARPDVWLGVDGNQGFERADLDALVDAMARANVSLIEQPLKRGAEAELEGYRSPIPLAADESALTLADVPGLVGRFDVVNIKLDKCGGLTEGLLIAREAQRVGLKIMVGNMGGGSLATAPGFVLAQLCDFVDLDGPVFLARDRQPSVTYADGTVFVGDDVWGLTA